MKHRKIITAAVATVALTLLSACGGGGGGSGKAVNQPVEDKRPIIAAAGGMPLTLSSSAIKAGLKSRAAAADALLATDVYFVGGGRYVSVDCQGASCEIGGSQYYISDFDFDSGTYEGVMTRNGVRVGQGAARSQVGDGTETVLVYGGWLQHNFFFAEGYLYEDREVAGAVAYAASVGDATGSVPVSGSATWRGVMAAAEIVREEAVQGDATLTADFAASNIDVAFTNIRDTETGAARASIMFDNVPFTSDGFASHANGRIEGKFYGPGHVEAGGIFERGNTIGAFGARRQ